MEEYPRASLTSGLVEGFQIRDALFNRSQKGNTRLVGCLGDYLNCDTGRAKRRYLTLDESLAQNWIAPEHVSDGRLAAVLPARPIEPGDWPPSHAIDQQLIDPRSTKSCAMGDVPRVLQNRECAPTQGANPLRNQYSVPYNLFGE